MECACAHFIRSDAPLGLEVYVAPTGRHTIEMCVSALKQIILILQNQNQKKTVRLKNSAMKKAVTTFLFLQLVFLLAAQNIQLESFNEKRIETNKKAMLVLGGWAIGNIATGSILMGQKEGKEKYFHQMNLGWGAINLGIASFAYLSAVKSDPAQFNTYQSIQEQYGIQKILLFNAGLDLAYMAGGAYLIERSKNTTSRPERLKGFGESIILQGAFLFVFDIGVYLAHRENNDALQNIINGLTFHGNGMGFKMVF